MNTAVTSETGRLFECQCRVIAVGGEYTHIGEPLSTTDMLALMGLLARVSTDVNGQRTPLDEALATSWRHA
jgi:hypothetical protein